MSPLNYPFQLSIMPLIGAISTENCVILKPSEYSIETSKVLENIMKSTFGGVGTSGIGNYHGK
ncbi:hypothetical protein [Clostridium novyi]|uniref:hypothetical protein n=1 Tax=Clostridium novyi TaxID=1542 RepID=UPI0004DB0ADF|nr:hypothetical protein [Clostridium novyi]KEH86450.1 hypothetical protein Z967_05690 [Clostridium novyi A str. 4540]KEH92428.1 hypothetical protein Z964_06090 [Clostridium novyi A str. GD211209]